MASLLAGIKVLPLFERGGVLHTDKDFLQYLLIAAAGGSLVIHAMASGTHPLLCSDVCYKQQDSMMGYQVLELHFKDKDEWFSELQNCNRALFL